MTEEEIAQEQQTIKKMGLAIVQFITNRLCIAPNAINRKRTKVHATAIFDHIAKQYKCNDQLFVKALNYVHATYPSKYTNIEIPKKWNGGSHEAIPEIYRDETKMLCKVERDVQATDVYPHVEPRIWKVGDFVWVPKNSDKVMAFIADDILTTQDMNQ